MAKKMLDGATCIDFTALKEDQIYMEDFIKTYNQVKEERRKFEDYIRYNRNDELQPLNNDPQIVNVKDLIWLFKKLPVDPCTVRIRGLRVIFGLEKDKVIFFFSPVAMTRVVTEPNIPTDVTYDIDLSSPVYMYESGSFTEAELQYYTTCRQNYFDNIWIKRHKLSKFFNLQDDGSWESDTQEVIFSFQEIFHLYHLAYPCGEDSVYDQNLYFYNGVANYKNFFPHWRRKHTIFITVEDIDNPKEEQIKALSAVDQAANLAHLCPPNCSPRYYITAVYPCP